MRGNLKKLWILIPAILFLSVTVLFAAHWGSVYTNETTVANTDWFIFWDVSDTTDGPDGTVKSMLFSDLSVAIGSGGTHGSTHSDGGGDEIDGDQVVIDWVPTYFSRSTSPTEASALDQLTAHLYGIDRHLRWHTAGMIDPDVALVGRIGIDTDDHALRGYDGTNQFVYGHKEKYIDFSIEDPDQLNTGTGRADKWVKLVCNRSPFSMIITEIVAHSDSQNYDFDLFETAGYTDFSQASDSLIDLIECDTASTGVYTDIETTITDSTVDSGDCILFAHNAGTSGKVSGTITYYLNGDVP